MNQQAFNELTFDLRHYRENKAYLFKHRANDIEYSDREQAVWNVESALERIKKEDKEGCRMVEELYIDQKSPKNVCQDHGITMGTMFLITTRLLQKVCY